MLFQSAAEAGHLRRRICGSPGNYYDDLHDLELGGGWNTQRLRDNHCADLLHVCNSFLIVGIIGNYIAILFAELKDRPIYIVGETKNFPEEKE